MHSKTKYAVSTAQVSALFAAAGLGEVTEIAPLADGWYNNVLAVTAGGKKYVLKIAPLPEVPVLTHERELMRQELRFYALLRERTNVRAPRILHEDLTGKLIPCDWYIMDFLPGQRLDKAKLSPEEQAGVDEAIAGIYAQFHAIEGKGYGYEQIGLEPNWHLALRKMTRALADDCARFGKRCPLGEKLLGYIERHRALLEEAPCVLVHYDLNAKNIFYQLGEDGGAQLTVIDPERWFWGDPLGDYFMPEFMTAPEKKKFLETYNRHTAAPLTMDRGEQIRYWLIVAYLAVTMHTEKYSRYRPWNTVWWMDVVGTVTFGHMAFSALKRLSR